VGCPEWAWVVSALLERSDVNPEKADKWSKTPLYRAVAYGHEGAVRMLLERGGVSPNTADTSVPNGPGRW